MALAAKQRSFESILDTAAEDVERPVPLPEGTYETIIQGMPAHGESTKKKTPYVEFTHKIVAALDDVDPTALDEVGGIADKTIKNTYYTTPQSLFMLTDFLEACGIDNTGRTIRQMLDDTPNASVRILVKHEPSEDGQRIFARVNRAFKSE
jgi:hypothetical protein